MAKTSLNISLTVSAVRSLEVAPDLGSSGQGLRRLPWDVSGGYSCLEGLPGAGGSPSEAVPSWLASHCGLLAGGLSSSPHGPLHRLLWGSCLPQRVSQENKAGAGGPFTTLPWESCFSISTMFHRSHWPALAQCGGDQGCGYWEVRIMGPSWCLSYKHRPDFEELT